MKKCIHCGAQIADDSRFCSECGKEITQANVCPHCGASVGEGDAFCQNCGKSLNEAPSSETITYEEEQPKSGLKKYLPYILGGILLLGIIGYFSSKSSNEGNNNPSLVADSVSVEDEDAEKPSKQEEIKLITEWYDYVFGKKEISDDVLNKFLSSNAKKRIWTEDYEGCYVFWKFRTVAQDYDPNVGDVSKIEDISVNNDGWYEVKYLDMGYNGKTTIKVENSKIVDFIPDSSWNSNESSVENSNNTSDDSYSSSNNQAEVSNVLSECESQIRSIQSEIESLCNTYVQLISRGDADEFKHERKRMTLIRGVGEWQSKANTVFDRCIGKLNSLGETNAANRMQQEKRDFYSAAERIKNQALQRTGDDYYN